MSFLSDMSFERAASYGPADRFRFAQGALLLDCADVGLRQRFRDLYPDGRLAPDARWDRLTVGCTIRPHHNQIMIQFDDPEPLDCFAFCQALFADRGFVEGPARDGWRSIAAAATPGLPLVSFNGLRAIADPRQAWQPFIANIAVNRLLRLQRDQFFFHAATLVINGRGVLLSGPKKSGKTTTALTLTARGHAFLGDEVAAVSRAGGTLSPMRRAAAMRDGVKSSLVMQALAAADNPAEIFPDGERRTRIDVAAMFPAAAAVPGALSAAFFLRQKSETPRADAFRFGAQHMGLLTPLPCCFWEASPGRLMLDLAALMASVQCYHLDIGLPDATAELVEKLVGGLPS